MGWMIATLCLFLGALTRVSALASDFRSSSEILLNSLDPEELENMVEILLQKLKEEIAESFEYQLRRHHQEMTRLERRLSGLEHHTERHRRRRRDASAGHYWHSYNFDTHRDREVLKINGIAVEKQGSINITKVIELNLWNYPAIYKTRSNLAYVLMQGRLQPLLVKNSWTKSLRGCSCNHMNYQVHDTYSGCACCHPGYCQCPSQADTCVPCNEAYSAPCEQQKPHPLLVDNAVGFQYYLDYFDTEHALQRILIVHYGAKLSFYRMDDDGVQLVQSETGFDTQSLDGSLTHMGYGEIFKHNGGTSVKLRFLFTFTAGKSSHRCYMINTGHAGFIVGVQLWEARGTEMKVWQVDGRVLVGVLNGDSIIIKELAESSRMPKYELRRVQTLRMGSGARILSWSSFTMAFESYMVVATQKLAHLYIFGNNYTRIQLLTPPSDFYSFSAIVAVKMAWLQGRTVLIAGQGQKLAVYVWHNTTQNFNQAFSDELGVHVPDWHISLGIVDAMKRQTLVFVQGNAGPLILRVEAKLEEVEDPVAKQVKALHGVIQPLKMAYKRQLQVVQNARSALEESSKRNLFAGDVVVHGGIQVQEVLDTYHLMAEKIVLPSSSGEVAPYSYEQNVNNLPHFNMLLSDLNHTVVNLHLRLNDAVLTQGSHKRIEGKKTILNGGIRVMKLSVHRLGVGRPLDSFGEPLPLDDMLTSIVRVNDTREVTGKKTILQPLSVRDLNIVYLDDVRVQDLVTSRDDHVIGGSVAYSQLMAQTVALPRNGTVGGIDLSEEVVTLSGDANLGECIFKGKVIVDSLTTMSNIVDGVNIQRLVTQTLTTLGGTIQGSIAFKIPPKIDVLNTNRIMGVDINKFMKTTVFRNMPHMVSGRLFIPSIEVRGDLSVAGFINNKKFPEDYIINKGDTVDFGAQWFHKVVFDNLQVGPEGRIDGILPSSMVTLHTQQMIPGAKKFAGGVFIGGDLNINSKVIDKVNLSELNSSLAHIRSGSWKFDVVFEQIVTVPSVSCAGTLNGLDWGAFVNDIVYDDLSTVVINSETVFRGGLTIDDGVFHSTFNGETFNNFVKISNDTSHTGLQVITGTKTFLKNVTVESLTTDLVADVDIKKIADTALHLNKFGQTVTGMKTFTSPIKVKELVVTNRISSLAIDQIVRKSTDQVFTAPQSFLLANFTNMRVDSIHMAQDSTVNRVNIPLLNSKRVRMHSYYSGVLTVEGPIMSHSTLTIGSINGHMANQLTSNLVMKEGNFDITGRIRFTTLSVDGPVTTERKILANHFNISDINEKAIHLTDNLMITGNAMWADMDFRQDVTVGGLVSGVELQVLSSDVVYLDQISNQVIEGKKTFKQGLTIHQNLEALTINGVDLRTRLLTRDTEQVITAPYQFVNVNVKSALHLLGLYNNKNLAGLSSLDLGNTNVFQGKVTFHGEVSVGHLHLSGLYNGVNTAERMADSISLYETNVKVTGMKNFTANVTFQNLDVSVINYIALRPYLKHVVMSSSIIHLKHNMRVMGSVWAPLVVADSLIVEGPVDGVDYNKLMTEAIYLDRNETINGTLVFKEDIQTQGPISTVLLNDLSLATQYLTTNIEQSLPATLVVEEATTAQVDVGGKVNGWHLKREVAATMKAIGGQTLYGNLTLLGQVEVTTDLLVEGLVGHGVRIDIARQTVNLHQNTHIEGSLKFTNAVVASTLTSVTGMVNKLDIQNMLTSAWYVNRRVSITVPIEFQGHVVFEGALLTNSTQNLLQLENLQYQLISAVTHHNQMSRNLTMLYKETCGQITPLYKELQHAIYEADHFEALYEDLLPHHRHSSEAFYAFGNIYLIITSERTCETTWYFFGNYSMKLDIITVDTAFHADEWLFIGGTEKEVYVAAASSGISGQCEGTSTIWRITNTTIEKYKTLNKGQHLSMASIGDLVTLRVHSTTSTTTYTFNLASGEIKLKQTLPKNFDLYSTITAKGHVVTFRSSKGHGVVAVDGSDGEVVEAERSIDDSVLLEEDGRVYLLLAVTRENMHRDEYTLELYLVDLVTRMLEWESMQKMDSKTLLTVFYAGSPTTGSHMVVALPEGLKPVIYNIVGATLKEFAVLSTQHVSWIEHIEKRTPHTQDITHYLVLGQRDRSIVLTKLVMRGATVPQRDHICY